MLSIEELQSRKVGEVGACLPRDGFKESYFQPKDLVFKDTVVPRGWGHESWVSSKLVRVTFPLKKTLRLLLWALAFCQSEYRICGLCVVKTRSFLETWINNHLNELIPRGMRVPGLNLYSRFLRLSEFPLCRERSQIATNILLAPFSFCYSQFHLMALVDHLVLFCTTQWSLKCRQNAILLPGFPLPFSRTEEKGPWGGGTGKQIHLGYSSLL